MGSLAIVFSLVFSVSVPAQDLAEIARQERARREAQPHHVYTNDDLKRDHILTPEDRQRVEADKVPSQAPAGPSSASKDAAEGASEAPQPAAAPQQADTESLGDIARRFLALKAQQDSQKREQQARLKNQLPLELPPPNLLRQPPLAYPMFAGPIAEPRVKLPVQPGPVTGRRMTRRPEGLPAPSPVLRSAGQAVLSAPRGELSAMPSAPWAPYLVPNMRRSVKVSAPPSLPAGNSAISSPLGALASLPAVPVAVTAPARAPAQGRIVVPPAIQAAHPLVSGLVVSDPVGGLASLPSVPLSATAVPYSRAQGQVTVPPAIQTARPFVSGPVGGLASLPAVPLSPAAAPYSRAQGQVTAPPAIQAARPLASDLGVSGPAGGLASLPKAPTASWPVLALSAHPRADIPRPPLVPLAPLPLVIPAGDLGQPPGAPSSPGYGSGSGLPGASPKTDEKGRPVDAASRVVLVHPGDTLWKLAFEYLGHGRDWPQLAAANPELTDPMRLRAGNSILVPEVLGKTAPGRRVQVQPGDTLARLARSSFGNLAAWRCLAQANPEIKNPDLIFPGEAVAIPEACELTGTRGTSVAKLSSSAAR